MKNYVVCFDNGYDNIFIEVDARSEKTAMRKAIENFNINYGGIADYIISVDEVEED